MSKPVTKSDAAGLVCRGLSLFFFVYATADLLFLPDRLTVFAALLSETGSDMWSTTKSYFVVAVLGLVCAALRLVLLYVAAIVLAYRPRFLRRFLGEVADKPEPEPV